jgi:hypothetical protein
MNIALFYLSVGGRRLCALFRELQRSFSGLPLPNDAIPSLALGAGTL